MKKHRIILLIAIVLAGTLLAIAGSASGIFKESDQSLPEARDEYEKLYLKYQQQPDERHIAGTIRLYDGENKNMLKEQSSFEYIKDGSRFYSRFMYLETFCDGRILLQLDSVNQMILVYTNMDQTDPAKYPSQSVDLLFSDTAAFKVTGEVSAEGRERTLVMKSDFNPEFKSTSITYDTSSYLPVKAEMHWWKDANSQDTLSADKVWITSIRLTHKVFKELKIEEMMRKIITIGYEQVIPAEKYKNYRVQIM